MGHLNKNLFRRLLFGYLIVVLAGLGAVGLFMSYTMKDYMYDMTKDGMMRKANKVNLSIQDLNPGEAMNSRLAMLDGSFDTRVWVFGKNGEIIATSTPNEVSVGKSVNHNIVRDVMQGRTPPVQELAFDGLNEPMLSVVVPWGQGDSIYGGIVLHSPVNGLNQTIGHIRETILWAVLIGLVISTAMVSYLSWSISRPLREIERVANKIGIGDFSEKIEVHSSDEIGELATTINQISSRLEMTEAERKRLDQIRSDFLANASHELRTPLTALQGFLEALQDGLISEEGRTKYYDVMYHETLHMTRLVDDLMDLVKLENDDIAFSMHEVQLEALLKRLAFSFDNALKERGNTIQLEIEANLPRIEADQDRLEQMLNNLIKNANKFTEDGAITVTASTRDQDMVIEVKDTGVGISDKDKPLVWERFFKVDRGRERRNLGTGLGLSIVREIVLRHHGQIELQSEESIGTVFTITLPLTQQAS
ncbi:sensor histidine kinase [Aureibacillus halotolerans]|uniref:histidine kinase n=1 Tax=Aureibacillus halotolerans TaxID=1508390 RepID=A0A4V6PWK0_9BACI|nr:ATP-binding protein [Aureibacillus halotolerans]TDQ42227.1 signal transduction histidine kinase [Aureibacillus halotolerans]